MLLQTQQSQACAWLPCSEETLKTYFGQFGPLEACEVLKDRYTGAHAAHVGPGGRF